VLLGRNSAQRTGNVLGVPLPIKIDFSGVSHQIGQAGREFGKLAREMQAVRQKAEQIGRAVS
jgi:hypothetical protein